jgi:hypothetical protein
MQTRRRVARWLTVQATVLLCLGAFVQPAYAYVETPDDTWMTNGTVYALVESGGFVYAGGQFTKVSENPPGQTGARYTSIGLARFDADTGVGDRTWKVQVGRTDGKRPTVYAVAVADGNVFFGGQFDLVNGQPRRNFAAVSVADATLDPNVDALVGTSISQCVRAMVTAGSTVYVGGYFTSVDGVGRSRLAAFDTSGNLLSWKPRTAGAVRSLVFDCAGDSIYAGGIFQSAAGPSGSFVTRDSAARFDLATGGLEAWSTRDADLGNGSQIYDLAINCAAQQLIGGIGGQNFVYAFDISDDDGEALWSRQSAGNVQTVGVNHFNTASTSDDRVLFGGHFGGGVTYPSGACSQSKPKTARFGVTDIDGNCDLSWWPTFQGKFYGPWAILVTDDLDVWVGGQFTQVCDGTQSSVCVDQYFVARFTNV